LKPSRPVFRKWINEANKRDLVFATEMLEKFTMQVNHDRLTVAEWIAIDWVKHVTRLAAVRCMTVYTDGAIESPVDVLDLDALYTGTSQHKGRLDVDINRELGF
jgi:hypothetical protein